MQAIEVHDFTNPIKQWTILCDKQPPWKEETHYLHPSKWWFNGHLLCNTKKPWGVRNLEVLLSMLQAAAANVKGHKRVLFNRRDFPWIRKDGKCPYTFLSMDDPAPACTDVPLSFYGGSKWKDRLIPVPEHWNVWRETESMRSMSYDTLLDKANYRGSFTGKYLDERNIRYALCKTFWNHASFDVGLCFWTNRERIIQEGLAQRLIIPDDTITFCGMKEQQFPEKQAQCKILLYTHGHCASSRLAWQLCSGRAVLYIESECDAPDMWFTPLIPWIRFRDLESLQDQAYVRVSNLMELEHAVLYLLQNQDYIQKLSNNAVTLCETIFSQKYMSNFLAKEIESSAFPLS